MEKLTIWGAPVGWACGQGGLREDRGCPDPLLVGSAGRRPGPSASPWGLEKVPRAPRQRGPCCGLTYRPLPSTWPPLVCAQEGPSPSGHHHVLSPFPP